MPTKHKTVSRVVQILEFVVANPGEATLTNIADSLAAPRSSVHGFVKGLEAEGYLVESAGGSYVFGLGAHTLLASQSTSLVELVAPTMRRIRDAIGETVTLAVLTGSDLTYVHSEPSPERIAYNPELHSRRPLWPTSCGKVFLAYPDNHGLVDEVVHNLDLDRTDVDEELDSVRRLGYGKNIGETVASVTAVAVGLMIGSNLAAAVSIGGPYARVADHLEDIANEANRIMVDDHLTPLPSTM
ncbi:IclR family transcriptional regulator [Brevibacterium sp. FAM 24638]|uniref:IclR family transcriptional regulator n=1 Tax=unclassified Brevibacterium TaxID=2614124 RepID=UPI003C7C914D